MFFIFLLQQVNSFLAEKNICGILCELLNKDYYCIIKIIIIIIIIIINFLEIC